MPPLARVSPLALALVVAATLGCGHSPTTSQPTAWLKVETRRHRTLLPHVLAVGESSRTLHRLWKGRWQELSSNFSLTLLERGRVLVRKDSAWFIYERHLEAPVALPPERCDRVGVSTDGERLVCAQCSVLAPAPPERPPYGQWRDCDEYRFSEFDTAGQLVGTRVATFPEEPRWCTMGLPRVEFTPAGDPILRRTCPAEQSGGGWVSTALAVTRAGLEALPPDAAEGASRDPFEGG